MSHPYRTQWNVLIKPYRHSWRMRLKRYYQLSLIWRVGYWKERFNRCHDCGVVMPAGCGDALAGKKCPAHPYKHFAGCLRTTETCFNEKPSVLYCNSRIREAAEQLS